MDGRDFGPHRSVHVPPPLLSGLAMESHRLGAAAAAGRIPPSPGHLGAGHPAALHTGKFLSSAMNLHSHHSKCRSNCALLILFKKNCFIYDKTQGAFELLSFAALFTFVNIFLFCDICEDFREIMFKCAACFVNGDLYII